jgi:hypothetical protein
MEDLTLYPVWRWLPRPTQFPQDWRFNRLLAGNCGPGVGQRPDHRQKGISLAA